MPRIEQNGKLYVRYEVIGKQHVAVPTHFFKVILVERAPNNFELESYLLPNVPIENSTPLNSFLIPLESIERAAGFLIFEKLPKNQIKKLSP